MRNFVAPLWRDVRALRQTTSSGSNAAAEAYYPPSQSSVFLVHGYRGSLYDYSGLAASLSSAGVRVCGVSYAATRPIVSGQERLTEALTQVPAGHKVCIVGHSLGGILAAKAALDHPDLVSGVVAISSPLRGTLWARLPMSYVPGLDALRPGSPYLRTLGLLGSPSQPLLCVAGTGDAVSRPSRALCRPGPGRRSVLLPEGHHSILTNERAHQEILSFVLELEASASNVL